MGICCCLLDPQTNGCQTTFQTSVDRSDKEKYVAASTGCKDEARSVRFVSATHALDSSPREAL